MITQPFSSLVTQVFDTYWSFFPNHIAPQIHELFCQEKDNNMEENLLDVCCGSGHLGKYFLEKGFSVTGIDLSDQAIKLAKEKKFALPAVNVIGSSSINGVLETAKKLNLDLKLRPQNLSKDKYIEICKIYEDLN